MNLNLGCGMKPVAGWVNVDAAPYDHVDVVHDLDVHPWPWGDDTGEEIRALHIFEHVVDPIGFMAEAWRVLAPGRLLHIEVPHWQSRNAFTDPTHRRFCTEDTFRYWVPGTWLWQIGGEAYHRNRPFREQSVRVSNGDLIVDLRKEDNDG